MRDARLCYQYAVLAGEQGVSESEARPAIERAVALDPTFDDTRYSLALIESNAGQFQAALEQFHAMRPPSPARAFAYWTAVAYAATETDRRQEAENAAKLALENARTPSERSQAIQARYLARTDLSVQFARGENGETRLMTTRVPHGIANFNPFIEPQDRIQQTEGRLQEVRCDGGRLTGFLLTTMGGTVLLNVPDPGRVSMRNSSGEVTCGAQAGQKVVVQYALGGNVLRGMEFR